MIDPAAKKYPDPLYISDAFPIKKDADLDFFDANLAYDSRLFLDPFLLKKSKEKKEVELYERFADFFRNAYDRSVNIKNSKREHQELLMLLNFSEPKEIGLGYAEFSRNGSSPGEDFANLLIKFFLNDSARRLIKEDNLYPGKRFNPLALEMFTTRLGVDGLSDITANLIMDYLIEYTQKQCVKHKIKTKEIAVDSDGFDFDPEEMNWKGGDRYKLPENPLHPGQAVIFVPKRLLRAGEIDDEKMVKKVRGILNLDPHLTFRFTKILEKEVDNFNINDIRRVMLDENSVFKKYMKMVEEGEDTSYDFSADPLAYFASKKYRDVFKNLSKEKDVKTSEDVLEITNQFFMLVDKHLSKTDIWRDLWVMKKNKPNRPCSEKVIQRIVFAMGKAYFDNYPEVTFEPEVGTGNGPVDFIVIYKSHRIAIELKRLLSSEYLDGIKKQLPEYAYLADTEYAFYVTFQHWTPRFMKSGKKHDDDRVLKIEHSVETAEKELKKKYKNFKKIIYININVSPKSSASKKNFVS